MNKIQDFRWRRETFFLLEDFDIYYVFLSETQGKIHLITFLVHIQDDKVNIYWVAILKREHTNTHFLNKENVSTVKSS